MDSTDRGYPLVLPTNTLYILEWSEYLWIPRTEGIPSGPTNQYFIHPWMIGVSINSMDTFGRGYSLVQYFVHPWIGCLSLFFCNFGKYCKVYGALDMSGPQYTTHGTMLVPGTQHTVQYWSLVHNCTQSLVSVGSNALLTYVTRYVILLL